MGKEHEQKPNELETQGEVATLVANAHQSKRQGIGVLASQRGQTEKLPFLIHLRPLSLILRVQSTLGV